jgi:TPR repeat protein
VLYDEGRAVERNHQIATRYYRAAAKQGDMRAVFRLAILHESCDQPKPNLEKAYMWFTVADQKGLKNVSRHLQLIGAKLKPETISRATTAANVWLKQYAGK